VFACWFLSMLGGHKNGSSTFLRNVGKFLPHYIVSHSKTYYFFLIYLILPTAVWPWIRLRNFPKGKGRPARWSFGVSQPYEPLRLVIGIASVIHISSFIDLEQDIKKKLLRGLCPRANYTDRATAACRRSRTQFLRIEGATWSA
jgi:hypothetical protein